MFKIKYTKKDHEPIYLIGKYDTIKTVMEAFKAIADRTMIKYKFIDKKKIEYENGDILEIEAIPFTEKEKR